MRVLAIVFGAGLALEGTIKQLMPKQWMDWMVEWPLAYLPEPVVKAGREYQQLSPLALRILGMIELGAGATILWLVAKGSTRAPRY